MNVFLIATLLIGAQGEADTVDKAQFLAIMARLQSEARDATFLFEGNVTYSDRVQLKHPERANVVYQGNFEVRSDASYYQETFVSAKVGNFQVRSVESHQGFNAHVSSMPNLLTKKRDVLTRKRPPGYFQSVYSPASFLTYFLLARLKNPFLYEFKGWELIDGHRCLKVQIDESPGSTSNMHAVNLFWFDLDRGGHFLRSQVVRGGGVSKETDQIRLVRRQIDGKSVWFPVSARIRDFLRDGVTAKEPFITEQIYVVNETLLLNRGLEDRAFDLTRRLNGPENPQLKGMRAKYEGKPVENPSSGNRALAAKQRLDAQLAEAEKQKSIVDASAAARAEGTWNFLGDAAWIGLAAVPIVLLGIFLKSRSR